MFVWCLYIYIYAARYIYREMYIHVYIYTYICIYIHIYVCMQLYMHMQLYIHMCMQFYISVCLYTYVYIYIYLFIPWAVICSMPHCAQLDVASWIIMLRCIECLRWKPIGFHVALGCTTPHGFKHNSQWFFNPCCRDTCRDMHLGYSSHTWTFKGVWLSFNQACPCW
jgi:hypothetical protein